MPESTVLSTRESQLAALEILRTVDALCRRENLRYYLAYGTLIGAIRHHGFIPWDDDLDILMPRPDYDRLLYYFDSHADEMRPLVAVHNTNLRKLPFLITRISDTTYRQIGESALDVPEMGSFIDVYPLDGLGNSVEAAKAEKRRCFSLMISYLRAGDFNMNNRGNGSLKRAVKHVRSKLMKSPSHYEKLILESADAETYERSELVSCKCWTVGSSVEVVDNKDDYGLGVPVEFEDMVSVVPSNYDAVLRRLYGDYMILPPEEKRIGHHVYRLARR